ncbi:MAG TPA: tetratricopeptide repeat protein [Anaeromyxobacteraceae bacterium]|nr:tetratricopeptide repeat protein [Anaeromyxobacteraceae bacterium]
MRLVRPLQLAAFLVCAAGAGAAASRMPLAQERPYDVAVVPPAPVLRFLSLGHPTLAANLYWLRTVQYVGEPRANRRGWERLLPLADLVTDLDPGHGYAYQVAGIILGSVGRVAESNAILEKGMRNVPDRYILPYLRAFNAFYYDGDFALAGKYVEMAANAPGAPSHLRQNVLAMYVKGGRADAAVAFLSHALEAAEDEESRKAIQGQLDQARFEREAARVDEAVAAYRARYGLAPPSVELLVAEGLLPALPEDPFGGRWILGEDGRARTTAHDHRLRPPEAPQAHPEPAFDPGRHGGGSR